MADKDIQRICEQLKEDANELSGLLVVSLKKDALQPEEYAAGDFRHIPMFLKAVAALIDRAADSLLGVNKPTEKGDNT